MARSRWYQKSRHGHESCRRPVQSVDEMLATFTDGGDDEPDPIETDPALPAQERGLRFYLSERHILELHRDERRLQRLLRSDILFWHYNSTPEPVYAYA